MDESTPAPTPKASPLRIVIGGVILVIVIGVVIWAIVNPFLRPTPGTEYPLLNRIHIEIGTPHDPYNSNPPTSGWHYIETADWGVYDEELPDEQLVHNLEHGGIWISYQPSLAADQVQQLKDVVSRYSSKVILTARAANDAPIAVAAWGWLDKMDTFDEARIVEFIEAYRDRGPERTLD